MSVSTTTQDRDRLLVIASLRGTLKLIAKQRECLHGPDDTLAYERQVRLGAELRALLREHRTPVQVEGL